MSDFKKEQNSNNIPKLFSPRLFQTNQNKTTHNQTRSIVHTPTIMDPSLEFSKNYYSKANFQKLILRNVLTPSTPQIFSRRISMKNDKSTQISNIQSVRMPTEAFTKWRNEDKGQILFVEDGILEKEENNKAFKRFDDAMETHNSWVKSFDQEKTAKNLLFKQLEYNEKSKEVLKNTLDKFHKGSVKNLIDKVGTFQKKIIRMPPIKKKKKKIQNFLTLNKDFVGYTTIDSFEEDTINNYTFYWNILNHNLWKPTVREGATFTSYEGKIYLYGGLSNELHSELCELDIKSEWTWKKVKTFGDLPSGGRAGHSIFLWKTGMLVFGGEKKYNKQSKIRECFNDLRFLNFSNLEWKWIRPFGDLVEARRNNAYCSVGKWLFVHGGINNYGKYLNDFYVFNLDHMKWMFNEISNETEIEGIAFHTMCGVFNGEPKLNSLYYPFEYAEKRKTNIKCVGLYIFGGKMKDGQTLNTLSYIKLGMKPLKWLILETEGQKPNPRFYHSMNYYSQLNVLIIYGGKTDAPATIKMKDFDQIFSDVWILNLVTLNWMQVRTNRIADLDRCGHATTILESKLLVFGGYNKNNYANANIYCMELDQKKANKFLKENKLKTTHFNQNPDENQSEKDIENQSKNELDPIGLDGYSKIETITQKAFKKKYEDLSFSNFRSFLPIPRKEDLI